MTDGDTTYRVLVDVEMPMEYSAVDNLFDTALCEEVAEIGDSQYQITIAVSAPNTGEAYRRAVQFVHAAQGIVSARVTGGVRGATVYGPDDETEVYD